MLWLIALTVLLTSVISGILGMAGGMILMGTLSMVLPVATAMILHGVAQAAANGSRAVFLRQHIRWKILPLYFIGALLAYFGLRLLSVVPSKKTILLILGFFPILAIALPKIIRLNMLKKTDRFFAGLVVTATQIIAGASGPILDVFYLNSPLNKFEIVASKAVTQTLGHLIKLIFYTQLLLSTPEGFELPMWMLPLSVVLAVVGTRLGKKILVLLSESQFQRYSRVVVVLIGLVYIWRGFFGS